MGTNVYFSLHTVNHVRRPLTLFRWTVTGFINFLNKAIGTIYFAKPFLNFMDNTMI